MTTGMLAKDLAKILEFPTTAQSVSPQATQATQAKVQQKQAPQKKAIHPKKVVIDGELAAMLKQVQSALAMAIGPIAGPVMKDTVKKWAKQAPPSTSSLPNLTKLLCAEINEKGLEQGFKTEIKKIF